MDKIRKRAGRLPLIIFCILAEFLYAQKPGEKTGVPLQPKLVIGIVVDQMRHDYLYRFADKFGDGGFKRMLSEGFECRNTHYEYVPTYTGPGHAAIYTGTTPHYNGIIGNDWYDRASGSSVYVTGDAAVAAVGSNSKAGKMSPKWLLSTTITDELRLSNNKQSKVIGVCIKDRGSILPAGHIPSAAYWFDGSTGTWITSTYYAAELPKWVKRFNDKKLCDSYLSQPWTTTYPIEQYTIGLPNGSPYRQSYKGEKVNQFPHDLPAIKKVVGNELIRSTPFGNSYTVDFALEALAQEQLGKDGITDFLAVSFSSTDYVGHQFGINSIELQDTYIKLDKDLARLFHYVDSAVDMDNTLIFLTADHAAAQTPAQMLSLNIPAGVFNSDSLKDKLNAFLSKHFGDGQWMLHYANQQFWLNNKLIEDKKAHREELIELSIAFLKKMNGVQEVYATAELSKSNSANGMIDRLLRGFSPLRSGDIALVFQPGWFDAPYAKDGGTTHGTGYAYDTHVPLLWMGWKIQPGSTSRLVGITDIAATLSDLLHISRPNACVGNPITDVIFGK